MAQERYATRHRLPDDARGHLAKMRSLEDAGGDRSAATTYLKSLQSAGWSLRELANGFGGVTAKTIADRLSAGARQSAPTAAAPSSLVVSLNSLRPATAAAWSAWCEATSRPLSHQVPSPSFVKEFDNLEDLGYDVERLHELVLAGAHLEPAPGDRDDVERAVWAFAYLEGEEAATAAAGGPVHSFPEHIGVSALVIPVPADHPTPKTGGDEGSRYVMDPEVAATIASLAVRARRVRGSTAADHPDRLASQELTLLMAKQRADGATYTVLGAAAGVTYTAVKFRLARYGFASAAPSQAGSFVSDLSAATFSPSDARDRGRR